MDRDRLDLDAELQLPAAAASAARARRFIAQFCDEAGVPAHVGETAALLVSELATNAVVHARTGVTVKVHRPDHHHLRIEVVDDNTAVPPAATQPQSHSESGRGLQIVSVLSDDWGINAHHGGKAVWFRLTTAA